MWVGINTLELNEATMKEALQYWLTNKVVASNEHAPTVDGVRANVGNAGTFRVTLKSEDD